MKITPDRVKVLAGDTLVINCSGETSPNERIEFTWDFPRIKVSDGFNICLRVIRQWIDIYGIVFVFRITGTLRDRLNSNVVMFMR